MQDNKNHTEESLFTQMFGQPSEQPPLIEEKNEVTEEPIINSQNITEEQVTELSNNNLNNESTINIVPEKPTEIIELSTKKQEIEDPIFNLNEPIIPKEDNSFNNNVNNINNSFNNNFEQSQTIKNNEVEETPLIPNKKIHKSSPIIGIVLLLSLISVLAFGISSVFSQKKELNNKLSTNNVIDNKEEEKTQEKPKEPEPELVIEFDESLSFEKGISDNMSEVNQTEPYVPSSETGVIKCSNQKRIKTDEHTYLATIYLYYEKLQLKKAIQHTTFYFTDSTYFNNYNNVFRTIANKTSTNESNRIKYTSNYQNSSIETTYYFNLAYGNLISFPEEKFYFKLSIDYNDNIRSTLGSLIYSENNLNNLVCSSLKV